jgi:hypothetical protein
VTGKKRPPCFQCGTKPGRRLVATCRDDRRMVYANATKLPIFCSMRCAANYALLWVEGNDYDRIKEAGFFEEGKR